MSVSLSRIIYRIATDSHFRSAFYEDPRAAVAGLDVDLNDEELGTLLAVGRNQEDPSEGDWLINELTLAALG